MSAPPIGSPGCPELAFSTASIDRNLIVLTASRARSGGAAGRGIGGPSWGATEPERRIAIQGLYTCYGTMSVMAERGPKSAYEIAMEKLKARDREKGVAEAKPLGAAEKARIAEIRTQARAKLAEMEILWKSERLKLMGAP